MSSQQLLKETQRAAGDENLSTWHQTLIDSGKELKGIQDVRLPLFIPSWVFSSRLPCLLSPMLYSLEPPFAIGILFARVSYASLNMW